MHIDLSDLMQKNQAAKEIQRINDKHPSSDMTAYLFQVDLAAQPDENGDLPIIGSTICEFGNWIETTGKNTFEKMYAPLPSDDADMIHFMQTDTDTAKQESDYIEVDDTILDMIDLLASTMYRLCDRSYYGVITHNSGVKGNDILVLRQENNSDAMPKINSYFINQDI